ncbi:MAG: hypothetical protein C6W54_19105 [Bacillaceae bacterium]|nr:MAG: hypothetical protein C6W54_19105 [Bacillaceae bacterium]
MLAPRYTPEVCPNASRPFCIKGSEAFCLPSRCRTRVEDSLQFFHFEQIDPRKISSTNILERLNREIRRRTSVVGVFPNQDSYIRLVTSSLMEYHEDWSIGRSYISPTILQEIQEQRKAA